MLDVCAENMRVSTDFDGNMALTLDVCNESVENLKKAYSTLKGKKLSLSLKVWRNKRSIEANAYLWTLCDKIAQQIRSTKEDVYREHVRRVGVFQDTCILTEAVPVFEEHWRNNGVAWFIETVDTPFDGYREVRMYFGSSTYNTAEMSRLIDEIIHSAEELGIPTLTEKQIEKMKAGWRQKHA